MPQGSDLGPILYLIYPSDIPQSEQNTIATFADDTVLLAVDKDYEEVANKLQTSIYQISIWVKRWRIKLKKTKSIQINFTNEREQQIPININNV